MAKHGSNRALAWPNGAAKLRAMVLSALLTLSALAAAQPAAADPAETVFACSFGARQVEVMREGARLTYQFEDGRAGPSWC